MIKITDKYRGEKMIKVLVLMSSYNGEKYISEQIESILKQKDVIVSLYIRDDGSQDSTVAIIKKLMKSHFNISLDSGNTNLGYKRSFIKLLYECDDSFDYYAFADQDDIWLDNKLIKAVEKLEPIHKPCLYYGMMTMVDSKLNYLDNQQKFKEPWNKKSVLFQNFAQGSTIVFNKELMDIVRKYYFDKEVAHDIWLPVVAYYLGEIVGDRRSYILYRRHEQAVTEKMRKTYWKSLLADIASGVKVSNLACDLLKGYGYMLRKSDKICLNRIKNYRSLRNKIKILMDREIRKYSWKGTIMLKFAFLFNRVE